MSGMNELFRSYSKKRKFRGKTITALKFLGLLSESAGIRLCPQSLPLTTSGGCMRRRSTQTAFLVLAFLLFATTASAQVGINATISGTVADSSSALIPGVNVTATNTATGVVSDTITNEGGTYRFPSLQPGIYEVKASLPGFQ